MVDPRLWETIWFLCHSNRHNRSAPIVNSPISRFPAAQGLVLKPLIDKLIIRTVAEGNRSPLVVARVFPVRPTRRHPRRSWSQRSKITAVGKSIFDFAVWRGKGEGKLPPRSASICNKRSSMCPKWSATGRGLILRGFTLPTVMAKNPGPS